MHPHKTIPFVIIKHNLSAGKEPDNKDLEKIQFPEYQKLHALNLIDNMFDPDHQVMEPCIIICPTFYFETPEDEYVTPADNFAGDGRLETDYDLYYREVVEDLIPQIESQFNVYCDDFSEEGIKASRDHRAWSGFSRGCLCTYYMFNHDLEYFKYWVPMSAPVRLRPEVGFEASLDDCYNFMKEAIDAHPDLDFFIYGTAGGEKDTSNPPDLNQVVYLGDMMTEEFNFYAQQPEFSFGNDPEVNNLYIVRSEFMHLGLNVPYNWANAADVLFK